MEPQDYQSYLFKFIFLVLTATINLNEKIYLDLSYDQMVH